MQARQQMMQAQQHQQVVQAEKRQLKVFNGQKRFAGNSTEENEDCNSKRSKTIELAE